MIMSDLSDKTTVIVGASRGLGRGIAMAFAEAGARVVAVSRTPAVFPEPANGAGIIQLEVADAGDATVPASLLDRYDCRRRFPRRPRRHPSPIGSISRMARQLSFAPPQPA